MKQSFGYYLFLSAAFLVLPFLITNATLDRENTLRWAVIMAICFITGLVFFLQERRSIPWTRNARLLLVTGFVLTGWMAVSMVSSINPGDASYSLMRMTGLLALLILATILFSSMKDPLILSRFALIAGLIFIGFAYVQLGGMIMRYMDGESWIKVWGTGITSTLSNKNFFSESLVLLLPFILIGVKKEKRIWLAGYLFSLLSIILFIVLNQSLAALFGMASGLLFFLVYSRRIAPAGESPSVLKWRKPLFAVLILLPILSIVYFGNKKGNTIAQKTQRLAEYVSNPSLLDSLRPENNNSVFDRILLWRNSLRIIGDHPLMGSGLNNWKLLYPEYGVGGTAHINSGYLNFEHPHNEYLLIWAEQGPIGLLLYLLLFFMVLRTGLKRLRNCEKEEASFLLLVLSGIVAFLVISFFAFPKERTYSAFLVIAGVSWIISREATDKTKRLPGSIAVLLLIIYLSASGLAWIRLQGEIHHKSTLIAQLNKNWARVIREADRAESWIYPLDYTNTPFSFYRGMAWFYSGDFPNAIREYEQARRMHPNHLRVLNDLASAYERSGNQPKAVETYRQALKITPQFAQGILNISAAYYNMGSYDSAFYYIDRIRLLPKGMGEQGNYKKFLEAILNAKAWMDIQELKDSNLIQRGINFMDKKPPLMDIYDESIDKNQPFAKILNDRILQIDN